MARKSQKKNNAKQKGQSAFLRNPLTQVGILIVVAVIVISIFVFGNTGTAQASSVSPADAYQMVQKGAFLLDVRTQAEWDQYRAPGATLIPLDELPNRLNELPKNKQIVVICHSGNRSKTGRDILLSDGFQAVSVKHQRFTGGFNFVDYGFDEFLGFRLQTHARAHRDDIDVFDERF